MSRTRAYFSVLSLLSVLSGLSMTWSENEKGPAPSTSGTSRWRLDGRGTARKEGTATPKAGGSRIRPASCPGVGDVLDVRCDRPSEETSFGTWSAYGHLVMVQLRSNVGFVAVTKGAKLTVPARQSSNGLQNADESDVTLFTLALLVGSRLTR